MAEDHDKELALIDEVANDPYATLRELKQALWLARNIIARLALRLGQNGKTS